MDDRARFLCFALMSAAVGCGESAATAAHEIGATSAAIVGGAPDDATTSAVFIVAKVGRQTGYCSGVVVAPRIVLTAAHCSREDAEYAIFVGADYEDPTARDLPENLFAVSEHHPHPKHDLETNENDIGVLITEKPLPVTPAALSRKKLGASDIDRDVRIVGYGQTSWESKAIGRRRQATSKIAGIEPKRFAVRGVPNICLFDSGGPTYATYDGAEVVAGIHVLLTTTDGSPSKCDDLGVDVRVDAYTDFIDGYIEQHASESQPEPETEPEPTAETEPEPAAETTPSHPPAAGCTLVASEPTSRAGAMSLVVAMCLLARRRAPRS